MNQKIKTQIAVVGGGISGLSLAYFLKKKGKEVLLLEKNPESGGVIGSLRKDDFLIEKGPNTIMNTHPILWETTQELGLQEEMVQASKVAGKRYILKNGAPICLPMGPISFLKSSLFSWKGKVRLMAEPFIGPAPAHIDESLGDFVRRRIGEEFLDYAINPFVAGVYAGDPEKMSVKSALPKLYALEQEYGSLIKGAILGRGKRKKRKEKAKIESSIFSFKEGLNSLIQCLEKALGDRALTSTELVSLSRKDGQHLLKARQKGMDVEIEAPIVVFNIPTQSYEEISFAKDLTPPDSLKKISYSPVAVVYLGFKNFLFSATTHKLDGFGFLVPEKEKRSILGTLWSSSLFEGRGPEGSISLTTFVGGDRQPEMALLEEDRLIEMVKKELKEILGICAKPDVVWVKQWKQAIPQYHLGHEKIIRDLEEYEEKHRGLYLRGNFRGGVSVPDCILKGYNQAEELGK